MASWQTRISSIEILVGAAPRIVLCFLLWALVLHPVRPAHADEHQDQTAAVRRSAILVGVSDYVNLPDEDDLKGPRNDVERLRAALVASGLNGSDVTVLADGVEDAALPTLTAIEEAFAQSTEQAEKGDFLILYLSGHGSRQRDISGDEADRYDEIFLPVDVAQGPETPDSGTIAGALTDDRIGEFVAEMQRKGVTVWLIMDSCFSGSGVRAAHHAITPRFVSPSHFGIAEPTAASQNNEIVDSDAMSAAARGSSSDEATEYAPFLALYAAQAFQVAVEVTSESENGDEVTYGVLTNALVNRLAHIGDDATFLELFQAVLNDVAQLRSQGLAVTQTPFWESSSDAIIGAAIGDLGSGSLGRQQFAFDADTWTVRGGRLQGITNGSVLAVVDDALADWDAPIGYVQVRTAGPLISKVTPVPADCADPDLNDCSPLSGEAAALLGRGRFARLSVPAIDLELRLSRPLYFDCEPPYTEMRSCSPEDVEVYEALGEALAAVAGDERALSGATIQLNHPEYHVAVAFFDGRIWFSDAAGFQTPQDAHWRGSPSPLAWPREPGALPSDQLNELASTLLTITKAHNIITLATAMESDPLRQWDSQFSQLYELEPIVLRVKNDYLSSMSEVQDAVEAGEYDPARECAELGILGDAYFPPTPFSTGEQLKQCDRLLIGVTSTSVESDALDVNMIYIDASYGIEVEYRRLDGFRAEAPFLIGDQGLICSECGVRDGQLIELVGNEYLLLIAAPFQEGGAPFDLSALAQPGVPMAERTSADTSGPVQTRGGREVSPAAGLLMSLAVRTGNNERGTIASPSLSRATADVLSWTVVPREQVRSGE